MFDFARRIIEKWRSHKLARAEAYRDELKGRYHTFRALLANNEHSLDLLKSLELSFASFKHCRPDFADTIEELLHVTYEQVDGLNQLSGRGDNMLYQAHGAVADAVRQALRAVRSHSCSGPRCLFFDQIGPELHSEVGGKAASLAFLRRSGFTVPNGFVITPGFCSDFFSANGIEFSGLGKGLEKDGPEPGEHIMSGILPRQLREELQRCYRQIAPNGEAVSVRSSALVEDRPEHSFAGQFKTVLNVTSFESFENAFREVLASNYNARATAYRIHSGLPAARNDMAVICQRMVAARSAGVLFTLDPAAPDGGRMLISAVPGLGTLVVGGAAPADVYRPLRENTDAEPFDSWAQVTEKSLRSVPEPGGGIRNEELPPAEKNVPVLSVPEIRSLVALGRKIESLVGSAQDIEWAVTEAGDIFILQSRGIRIPIRKKQTAESVRGREIMRAGQSASPGRCVGIVKVIRSQQQFEQWREPVPSPTIMVLHQSLVDSARRLPEVEGVVVDLGNPADHLSCVAREYGRPMITGAAKATEMLRDGQWIVLDADRTAIYEAPEGTWADSPVASSAHIAGNGHRQREVPVEPEIAMLRDLIEPLNLTDAFGPTFSIHECRSVHDIIRYTHEMAVLAMFEAGDEVLEGAGGLVHRLESDIPFHVMMIDLGGGLAPHRKGFGIGVGDVLSKPFRAFWEGVSTPGLRWNAPASSTSISGLFSRAMLDGRSARPVGSQNYALVSGDYLNLNARVEYHFTMVDAICGRNPRENHIRFRFKGGGTAAEQRERRTRFIDEILKAYAFATDLRGDLLTASIAELRMEEIEERLAVLGRLMGFTRLLDAAMTADDMPLKAARAFLEGDYGLESLMA